jgi:short-subunit dehydrogenase
MNKVALITGASSGIGFETSLTLARNEFRTFATMRNLSKSRKIREIAKKERLPLTVIPLDVNDNASIRTAIQNILVEAKRIDVVINNAGYGLFGAVEDLSMDKIIDQFETNFFGVVRVVKSVLPIMRNQRSGTIINISSMVGRVAMPLNSVYVASKFALEGFSESIRHELSKFGINVILIEPGIVRTGFFDNLQKSKNEAAKSPYSALLKRRLSRFKSVSESNSSSPSQVAKAILKALQSKSSNFRYIVGEDAIIVLEKRKVLSDIKFERWIWDSIMESKSLGRAN